MTSLGWKGLTNFFWSNATTCSPDIRGLLSGGGIVYPTSQVGTPMRRGYVVPMLRVVIYEDEMPEGS
jgi:hypothetical protein